MNQQQATTEWLDQYEVLDIIGNGMFGVIKKVRNRRTGDILARKDLNFEKMTDKDRKQIVAEVNILKDLNHDHIVRYVDRHVDRENGYLYILMEYCGGGDLGRVLSKARKQGRPLSEETVWKYFWQLLQALNHCHNPDSTGSPSTSPSSSTESGPTRRTQQVLHRDIKPENVFLTEDGKLKLGDFGLSKQMGPATFANTYVGTPYYMSPEMLNEKAYDTKSDIWSLGCLIYELCALQPPFYSAKTQQELTTLIQAGRIPPLPRGFSSGLFSTIKSMLNLSPGARPSVQSLLANERLQSIARNDEAQKILDETRKSKEKIALQEKELARQQRDLDEQRALITLERETLHRDMDNAKRDVARERQTITEERERLAQQSRMFDQQQQQLRATYEAELAAVRLQQQQVEADRAQMNAYLAAHDEDKRATEEHWRIQAAEHAEFVRQKAEFERERAEFERQRAQWEMGRQDSGRTKKPLEDIQNQKSTIPLPTRYQSQDEVAAKAAPGLRRKISQDQNTRPTSNVVPVPTSRDETPPNRGSAKRLASKSNPNLGSAMKGVILTASGIAIDTPINGSTHDIPPVPPLPALTTLLAGATRASLDSPDSVRMLSVSDIDSPRQRLRRRSTISAPSRPVVSGATNIPTFNPATLPPAPVYDLNDEENLPSPFIKKLINEPRISSGWASVRSGFKKGPGLMGVATSNSASKSSIPTGGTSSSKSARPSIAKAAKASENAQRALLGRGA